MRIIGGDCRGIKLSASLGLNTRPTLDRIRESLFNILGQYFNGGTVLDLFAGSGCNGLEFLSRGVDFSYFVDNSSQSYNVITSNIEKCRLKDKSKVLKMDYKKALESFLSETFSYIYMDPPFMKRDYYIDSINLIKENRLLKKDGLLIIEHKTDDTFELPEGFSEIKNKKYGNTSLSIWSFVNESNICG